jgi:hypothetical protein
MTDADIAARLGILAEHFDEGTLGRNTCVASAARLKALVEALESDVRFFDSVAVSEHFEATGIGNLCRGYAERRRELLTKFEQVAA